MHDNRNCSECSAPLPSDAPPGVCPTCALRAALALDADPMAEPGGEAIGGAGGQTPGVTGPAQDPEAQPAQRFGDYELLDEIARGGMGIVYRARQISLDRIVAIKLLPFSSLTSAEHIKRFRAEASAAAALHHPNIVSVHEVGVYQGQHYLVMNLVQGSPLNRLVAAGPLPAKRAAGYVKVIAQAVHYAHEKGILHRDLKPSNVLIDENDQPQVTDFGLAKRLDGESSLTLTGQAIGSPGYMPPEQALAEHGKVTRRSDVYGLGGILYHLLTGRPPFQASTINQAIQQVAEREPLAPALLNPSATQDLQTICLKCLEKEPERRYQTAQEVADELEKFLNGEPIRARPTGALGKVWRWCRRRPVLAGLSLALLLTFVAGLSGVLWQWDRAVEAERAAEQERDRAISAEQQAGEERNQAQKLAAEAALEKGQTKLEEGDSSGLFDFVDAYRFAEHHPALREFVGRRWSFWLTEWDRRTIAIRPCRGRTSPDDLQFCEVTESSPTGASPAVEVFDLLSFVRVGTPLAHDSAPPNPKFSPDGRILATVTETGMIRLWDVKTSELTRPPVETHVPGLNWIVFSPDGRALVAYTKRNRGPTVTRAAFLRLDGSDEAVRILEHRYPVGDARFSPDGSVLALVCIPDLQLFRAENLQPIGPPIGITRSGLFEFNHDGTLLAVNREGVHGFSLLDPRTGRVVREIPIEADDGDTILVAFSHDGRQLASYGWDGNLRFWRMNAPSAPYSIDRMRGKPSGRLSFSPDDSLVAVGGSDGMVSVFNAEDGRILHTLHTHPNSDAEFLTNGVLVTKSYTHASFWDLQAAPLAASVLPDDALVRSLAFDPSGEFLAVGGGGELRIWTMRDTPRVERSIPVPGRVQALTYAKAQDQFVAYVHDGSLLSVVPRTGATRLMRKLDRGYLPTACFSPDARKLVLFRFAETLLVDTATGAIEALGQDGVTRAVCFSPDSQKLAEGKASWKIRLYDVGADASVSLREIEDLGGWVQSVAFHPNGRWLAANVEGRSIRLYALDHDGELMHACETSLDRVELLCFSPDGSLLATAGPKTGGGYGIEMWHLDPKYGFIHAGSILPCEHPVWTLAFSPTERKLVAGGKGTTRVWHLPSLPQNLEEVKSRTEATLGLRRDEKGSPVFSSSSAQDNEAIRNRLTRKAVPTMTPFDAALRLPPDEAVVALQSLASQHPGATIYKQIQARMHERLSETNADQGRWREALAHANEAVRLGFYDLETQSLRANLLCRVGDMEGYRASCRSMVEHCASTNDPEAASMVAFVVGLRPGALDDYAGLIEQIRRSISLIKSMDAPSYRFHLGRVLIRAGRYVEAVHELEQVDRFLQNTGARVNFSPSSLRFMLALCHARLGDADAARRWLDAARNDTRTRTVFSEDEGAAAVNWWFRLVLQDLRKEAEEALSQLEGKSSN